MQPTGVKTVFNFYLSSKMDQKDSCRVVYYILHLISEIIVLTTACMLKKSKPDSQSQLTPLLGNTPGKMTQQKNCYNSNKDLDFEKFSRLYIVYTYFHLMKIIVAGAIYVNCGPTCPALRYIFLTLKQLEISDQVRKSVFLSHHNTTNPRTLISRIYEYLNRNESSIHPLPQSKRQTTTNSENKLIMNNIAIFKVFKSVASS